MHTLVAMMMGRCSEQGMHAEITVSSLLQALVA
jgi:hypothetical protein